MSGTKKEANLKSLRNLPREAFERILASFLFLLVNDYIVLTNINPPRTWGGNVESYQYNLSKAILEELDPQKITLLDSVLKMLKEYETSTSAMERGIPFIGAETISMVAKPLVIAIIAGIISKLILKTLEKKISSKEEIAKIVVTNKKGIITESLQIAVDHGVDKKTISRIQNDVFKLINRSPEILRIRYEKKKIKI